MRDMQMDYRELEKKYNDIQLKISEHRKGNLRKKTINGREYYYLQYREGDKVISKYIKKGELNELAAKIERRRSLKKSLREIDAEMKKIERSIK